MITEDYVSFETAKLLKEKGFEGVCHAVYDKDGIFINLLQFVGNSNFKGVNEEKITFAPTLQMAKKWLIEKKKLYVNVWADPKDAENDDFRTIYRMHVYDGTSNYGTSEFSKDEEACETGIRYCLENLI